LISDASHSLGALFGGKSVPQLADAAVFSFHATKNLTCGEGGMVVSRDKSLVERVRSLSLHGITASAYDRRRAGSWAYDVTDLGFKANLSEVHAAVGLGNLEQFERNQAKRKRLAERYIQNLAELSEFVELPPAAKQIEPTWHLFIIKLHLSRLKIDRNEFIRLMARRGIGCGVHYIPIFEFSFYRNLGLSGETLRHAVYAGRRVVSLPLYPGLRLSDVDYVCEAIAGIVKTAGR
jgi:dTDP-4-amino-4,6-dideoxygalactose transaminase